MSSTCDTPQSIAADQHGLITAKQLLRCEWSRRRIFSAAERGVLIRTQFESVFSLGTRITTPYQRAMAAVLATGGLLSHAWCRWLFGVGRLPKHGPDITVTTNRRSRDGLTLHRTRTPLVPDANHGIPCTRPERMVIDCAETPDLRRLVNDVQIKKLASFQSLKDAVAVSGGRNLRALKELLAIEQRGATRSLLEDLLGDLSNERGLPRPDNNAIVDGYEVDFSYYDGAIILEADGYATHGTKVAFEDDREKWLALEARGRRVIPVSYRQVTELRERTADELEAIIRRPAPVISSATPKPAMTHGEAPVYGSVPLARG